LAKLCERKRGGEVSFGIVRGVRRVEQKEETEVEAKEH
jgi:hypothetical protein